MPYDRHDAIVLTRSNPNFITSQFKASIPTPQINNLACTLISRPTEHYTGSNPSPLPKHLRASAVFLTPLGWGSTSQMTKINLAFPRCLVTKKEPHCTLIWGPSRPYNWNIKWHYNYKLKSEWFYCRKTLSFLVQFGRCCTDTDQWRRKRRRLDWKRRWPNRETKNGQVGHSTDHIVIARMDTERISW